MEETGKHRERTRSDEQRDTVGAVDGLAWPAQGSDCHTLGSLYSVLTPVGSFVVDVTERGLSVS